MQKKNIIFGSVFILLGLGYLATASGLFPRMNLWNTVIVIGALCFAFDQAMKKNFFLLILSLGVVVVAGADYVPLELPSTRDILIFSLLIGIGVDLLFKHHRISSQRVKDAMQADMKEKHKTKEDYLDNVVDMEIKFGSIIKYIKSQNLESGTVMTKFSEVTVDFRHAKLAKKGATIEFNCRFSEVLICIPRTWEIDNQLEIGIFGSMDDDRYGVLETSGPKLVLRGTIVAAEVKIMYV